MLSLLFSRAFGTVDSVRNREKPVVFSTRTLGLQIAHLSEASHRPHPGVLFSDTWESLPGLGSPPQATVVAAEFGNPNKISFPRKRETKGAKPSLPQ